MPTPNQSPITSAARSIDHAKVARGKELFLSAKADYRYADIALSDMCYYLDRTMFLPAGKGKLARALRAEAKKRGVL
jgi:hypothetical protein